MAEQQVKIDLDAKTKVLLQRLRFRWGKVAIAQEARRFFDKEALRVAGRVARSIGQNGKLKRRSGLLAQSIIGRGVEVGGAPGIRVGIFQGPALAYAGVQEYGTKGKGGTYPTIRPGKNISRLTGRPTKALAVPVRKGEGTLEGGQPLGGGGGGLTKAGVARQTSPVDYREELAFIPVKRGKLVGLLVTRKSILKRIRQRLTSKYAVSKSNKGARDLDVVFLLLRFVDIAPKHYLRDGMLDALPEVAARLGPHLAKYLGAA